MKLTLKSTDTHPIILGSFPDLWKVGEYQGNPTNYSVQLLIPKGSPALAELEASIRTFSKEQWGDAAKMAVEKQNASNTKILRDGDGIDGMTADGKTKPGWAGHMRIKASSKFAPKIVDRSLQDLSEASGKPYAGCAVSAQIELYAFKDKKEMGVRLSAVQFYADGEPFGGGGSGGVDLAAFGAPEPVAKATADADASEW
jgi:hypothetical protein